MNSRKLNILFINSIRMWGGAEVWLMDIMHGLQNRGHEVTLLCRSGTPLAENARARGFAPVTMRMRSDFDPLVIAATRRLIRQRNIDVISTNMDKELRFGGIAAKLSGGTCVIPSREVDYPLKNNWRYRFTYNVLADQIVANSRATKQTLLQNAPWLDADRIEVIYKGIDPQPFLERPQEGLALRQAFGVSAGTPLVGFVGQIIERKGIPDIVEAIPLVLQQLPEAKFFFAGEGKLSGFLQSEIRRRGLANRVIYAGFRRDVPAIMKAIDVLILPSVVEGFGYVLVEAMAAGKPVVATNVSSIPEIVVNGQTGLLVRTRAPEELARAVGRFLAHPPLAAQMGERGRQRVLQHFTIDRMIEHFEAVFQRHVAEKQQRSMKSS